jgi:hypothetical protein
MIVEGFFYRNIFTESDIHGLWHGSDDCDGREGRVKAGGMKRKAGI